MIFRYSSLLILIALSLVSGCKLTHETDTLKNRPGEEGPRPPNWAWLDVRGISHANVMDGAQRRLQGVDGVPAVTGTIDDVNAIYFSSVSVAETNRALAEANGSVRPYPDTPTFEIPVSAEGYFAGGIFESATGAVSLVSLRKPNANGEVPLSITDLENCTTLLYLTGDLDFNGTVDKADFAIFEPHWQTAVPPNVIPWFYGDFNSDGFVNFTDFVQFNNQFNQRVTPWPQSKCR